MEYVLPLQQSDAPQRHVTTLHMMLAFLLFGISISCLGLYWFTSVSPNFKGIAFAPFLIFSVFALAMSVALIWLTVRAKGWMQRKRNNIALRIAELVLMGTAALLFYSAGWKVPAMLFSLMALVLVFALMAERRTTAAPRAVFTDEAIVLEGAGSKMIDWSQVERVVLRHNILTLSLRDNRLIQRSITGSGLATPETFEAWCSARITARAPQESAGAW